VPNSSLAASARRFMASFAFAILEAESIRSDSSWTCAACEMVVLLLSTAIILASLPEISTALLVLSAGPCDVARNSDTLLKTLPKLPIFRVKEVVTLDDKKVRNALIAVNFNLLIKLWRKHSKIY